MHTQTCTHAHAHAHTHAVHTRTRTHTLCARAHTLCSRARAHTRCAHVHAHARTHTLCTRARAHAVHTHTHTCTHACAPFSPKGITSLPAQGALCCLRQRAAFTISHVPAGCPPHTRYPSRSRGGALHCRGSEKPPPTRPRPRGGTGNRQLGKERNQTKAGETCGSSPRRGTSG